MTELPTPRRILIVDDHADLRKLIRLTLLGTDYEVFEATSGDEALRRLRDVQPDLIILDVMMPGDLNGYQVCSRVKADPALRHITVILVTARAQAADLQKGEAAGADRYLIKPFSPMQLLDLVSEALGT
ncbi:response regulator [uncultured Deinococcus sp.]|uniref:Response regulator n=1 Tax=Deinococcus rufus TaxID=2136097 RepID=A0ABV7ZAN7_9DEIO|nr:response regulator [uncultured Deinococcus sp.]